MSIFTRNYHGDGNYTPREPIALNKSSPQSLGLVAWYPGIETGGNTLYDYSENGFHATGTANVRSPTHHSNFANDFQAGQDYSASPANLASRLPTATPLTMMCWASGTSFGAQGAIVIRQGTGAAQLLILYPFDNSGGDGARVYWFGTILNQNDGTFNDGLPHHFIMTSRGSTDHELFVDGKSVATSSTVKTLTANVDNIDIGHWNGAQDATHPIWHVIILNRGINAIEAEGFASPEFRWDLALQRRAVPLFDTVAVVGGGRTMGSLAGLGGLAGPGGIAGKAGGLAG